MDTHRIAARYSILPVAAPPLDEAAYETVLSGDFEKHYSTGHDLWTAEKAMRETPRALLRALGEGSDAHVLDIGTGRGLDARILLEAGQLVTGVDLVASEEWAQITARWPDRARFEATPFGEFTGDGFDAVLDNGCLHHQHPDGYSRYLTQIHQTLRLGGLFTVSVFESPAGPGQLFVNDGNRLYREFTPQELTGLVTPIGFSVLDLSRVPRDVTGLHYLVATFRRLAPAGDR